MTFAKSENSDNTTNQGGEAIASFWDYDIDHSTGTIKNTNTDITYLSISAFLKLSNKDKISKIRYYISQVSPADTHTKLYIIYYIYYILYYTRFNLHNKDFYKMVLNKLIQIIKIDYFEYKEYSYADMKNLKHIYYLFTGVYICEHSNCVKDCSDKQKTYCGVHIRKKNKESKQLEMVTNLPFVICNIISEYNM